MQRLTITLFVLLSCLSSFSQSGKSLGNWTNGDESYRSDYDSQGLIVFSGGGLHEGGASFTLKSVDDNTFQVVEKNGWSTEAEIGYKVEVFEFEDQKALLFRDSKNVLVGCLRQMDPSENLYTLVLTNKTNHQLAGKYVRADNSDTVTFFPDSFKVKGLSSEETYTYAVDYIEFPMDLIFFSNGDAFAYEKTDSGLDIYGASEGEEEWEREKWITSLTKIEWLAPDNNKDLPGIYPFASSVVLTADILNSYSKAELRIMRNEIFARYGYEFNSADLRRYFGYKIWYVRTGKNVTNLLTPLEKLNIQLIQLIEQQQ